MACSHCAAPAEVTQLDPYCVTSHHWCLTVLAWGLLEPHSGDGTNVPPHNSPLALSGQSYRSTSFVK